MKIDLTSIIISVVVLSFFIVPIIYDQMVKEKHKVKQKFMEAARARDLTISTYDIWDDSYALGIDTEKQRLFYLKMAEEKKELLVNLVKVNSCSLSDTSGSIALSLVYSNGKATPKDIEFCCSETGGNSNDTLEMAKKWRTIINNKT